MDSCRLHVQVTSGRRTSANKGERQRPRDGRATESDDARDVVGEVFVVRGVWVRLVECQDCVIYGAE